MLKIENQEPRAKLSGHSWVLPLEAWGFGFNGPIYISGPCSVESEEQVMETAQLLSSQGVDVLRGGIWKPRTRPSSFEGVGKKGLRWLKDAGRAIGKPVCVEVANASHAYEALQGEIDILWIGARTSVSPFAVQEIADALRGLRVPVLVKNPINPDLELWIGAIERIALAGIDRIAAIHRGFSTHGEGRYRYKPLWEIPIELRRRLPGLPILCDPSHICGNRELLAGVAQYAFDLQFDGIMIEAHCSPEAALSDAGQQVTPQRYGEIIRSLVVRRKNLNSCDPFRRLEEYRERIDSLDHELIRVLARRMKVSRMIGEFKRSCNLGIQQDKRWSEIFEDRIRAGEKEGLAEAFLQRFLETVHQESIRQQWQVMHEARPPNHGKRTAPSDVP